MRFYIYKKGKWTMKTVKTFDEKDCKSVPYDVYDEFADRLDEEGFAHRIVRMAERGLI